MGIMETKSIMPYTLKMYLEGFFMENIRNIYSTLKMMVMNHSAMSSWRWYFLPISATLSKATITTLERIKINKTKSNTFPARVSAS